MVKIGPIKGIGLISLKAEAIGGSNNYIHGIYGAEWASQWSLTLNKHSSSKQSEYAVEKYNITMWLFIE